jgi:hypothetical protein
LAVSASTSPTGAGLARADQHGDLSQAGFERRPVATLAVDELELPLGVFGGLHQYWLQHARRADRLR